MKIEKKSEPPFVRVVESRIKIHPTEVNRILREYARGLDLRGYPSSEDKITIEIHDPGWEDTASYVGEVIVRYTEE